MTRTINALSWTDTADQTAPIAPYVVDFSIDLTWQFSLSGSYHFGPIDPAGVVIDNSQNPVSVTVTLGPDTIVVPALQRVNLRIRPGSLLLVVQCTASAHQCGVEFYRGALSSDLASLLAIQQAAGSALQGHFAIYGRVGGVQMVSIDGSAFSATGSGSWQSNTSGRAKIRVWGAGGGSGGTGAAQSAGGGGGGGAYLEMLMTGLSGAVPVAVGAGGAAGGNPSGVGTNGGAGGASSFNAISVAGGLGSAAALANSAAFGALGGVANAGINGLALAGFGGLRGLQVSTGVWAGGGGGSFGCGQNHMAIGGIDSPLQGAAGISPGQGASGGNGGGGTSVPGQAGADGLVLVEWTD